MEFSALPICSFYTICTLFSRLDCFPHLYTDLQSFCEDDLGRRLKLQSKIPCTDGAAPIALQVLEQENSKKADPKYQYSFSQL